MKVQGWDRNYIKDKDLFVAQLGPTGGQKGYGTITGTSPSEKSVCWWINGKLLPEIYVYRGRTYYFHSVQSIHICAMIVHTYIL